MTKSNRDSILQANFCDVVNYFRGRQTDDADQLAQRALTIIFLTDHLVQTGFEVDTDPFSANMFAGAALGSISCSIKQYPFVRVAPGAADVSPCQSADERDAVLDIAEDMIEMAEELTKRVPPPVISMDTGNLLILTEGFRGANLAV